MKSYVDTNTVTLTALDNDTILRNTGNISLEDNSILDIRTLTSNDGSKIIFADPSVGLYGNPTDVIIGLMNAITIHNNISVVGGEVSHAITQKDKILRTFQVGLPFAGGYMRNSQIIGEDFNETNATMIGFCDSYIDTFNDKRNKSVVLKVDCFSDTFTDNGTGGDLIVEDDIQLLDGTIFAEYGFEGKNYFLFDGNDKPFYVINSDIIVEKDRIENSTFSAGEFNDVEDFSTGLGTYTSTTWDEIIDTTYCNSGDICVESRSGTNNEMSRTYNLVNNVGINVSFYYGAINFDSTDNISFVVNNGSVDFLIWNYTGSGNTDVPSTKEFINLDSGLWNKSLIFTFGCTTTNPSEACFIDDINLTSFDSLSQTQEVKRLDGTIYFGDKDCYIDMKDGIRKNLTIACTDIFLEGNVTETSVTVVSQNVTGDVSAGSFTLVSEQISNWDNLSSYILGIWNVSGSDIFYDAGNVGIGTVTPDYLLQTEITSDGKDINLSNTLFVNGSSGKLGVGVKNPAVRLDINDAGNGAWSSDTTVMRFYNSDGAGIGVKGMIELGASMSYGHGAIGSGYDRGIDNGFLSFDIFRRGEGLIEAMRIDANGSVGLGTTTPNAKLDVHGDTIINLTDSNKYFEIVNGSGVTRFIVNETTGNVGLGTSNPDVKLDVIGTTYIQDSDGEQNIQLTPSAGAIINKGATPGTSKAMALLAGGAGSAFEYDNSGWFGVLSITNANVGTGSGVIQFKVDGSAPANSLIVDSTGNVGIGTTSPNYKLDVNGNINATQLIATQTVNTTTIASRTRLIYNESGDAVIEEFYNTTIGVLVTKWIG